MSSHSKIPNNKVEIEESEALLQPNAKSDYDARLVLTFANNNNPEIYGYIKSITKSNLIPSTVFHNTSSANTDSAKANTFNIYFLL